MSLPLPVRLGTTLKKSIKSGFRLVVNFLECTSRTLTQKFESRFSRSRFCQNKGSTIALVLPPAIHAHKLVQTSNHLPYHSSTIELWTCARHYTITPRKRDHHHSQSQQPLPAATAVCIRHCLDHESVLQMFSACDVTRGSTSAAAWLVVCCLLVYTPTLAVGREQRTGRCYHPPLHGV